MTPEGLYPDHDFICLMKLKPTLRYTKGDKLITHLGAEYSTRLGVVRHLILATLALATLVATREAAAGPPTGYQCSPGSTKMGVGCVCPSRYTSEQDGEGTAVCRAKPSAPRPVPRSPSPVVVAPPPRLPVVRAPTAKITLAASGSWKLAAGSSLELKPDIDRFSLASPLGLIRSEQGQILEDLIESTLDSEAEKADYLFRLAELYGQQSRYWREKGDPVKAKDYLVKANKSYSAVVGNAAFRNFPKLDSALFGHATLLEQSRYSLEARKAYERLIKDFPNSKHVPDAYLAFADYFFASNDLPNAETYYLKVLKYPTSTAYVFATYKQAFVHYRAQRYQEAIEMFFKVVELGKGGKQPATLVRSAQQGFVRAYAEIGKPDMAYPAFHRLDAAQAVTMEAELGSIYVALARHDKAAIVYAALITDRPDDDRGCAWQSALARASFLAGGGQLRTVDVCVSEIDSTKTWARTNSIDIK